MRAETTPNIAKSFIAILMALVLCADAANVYYVATNGDDTTHAGTNGWPDALQTISNAVFKAVDYDSIRVSNGTYFLTEQISVTEALDIRGFSGNPNDTIINGNYPTTTSRCFNVSHTNAVISAFTITNGCVVTSEGGGGVSLTAGVVSNCVVSGNRSFTTNTVGYGKSGGGISITITDFGALLETVISGNICSNNGGGISLNIYNGGSFVISNCTFSANTAITNVWGKGVGGGMSCGIASPGYLLITHCSFVSNVSCGSGGGIYYSGASLFTNGLISHCVFRGNSLAGDLTTAYGGGVHMGKGTLRNCLIANNSAPFGRGGGVYLGTASTGDKMLQNCTVVSNVSSTHGGGVSIITAANPYLQNCIIWGNSSGTAGSSNVSVEAGSTQVSFTNCCTAGGSYVSAALTNQYSTNNIAVDPILTAEYHLQATSPCINKGANQEWMPNTRDLDGLARLDHFSRQVDMGAYEFLLRGMLFTGR